MPRGRSRPPGQKECKEVTTFHWGKQEYLGEPSVTAGYGRTVSIGMADVELGRQRETGWVSVVTHFCLPHNAEQNASHGWRLMNIICCVITGHP